MAEQTETTAVESQTSNTQESVIGKYADKLNEQRAAQKTEATKTEPIAETTEVVAETTEVVAEIPQVPSSNGKAKEPIKEVTAPKEEVIAEPANEDAWRKELGFDDTTAITPEAKKTDDKEIFNSYKEKADEYEKLTTDPFIVAYNAAKKAGKDVSSFLNEVKGKDVNSMTPDQLWGTHLTNEGLSAEDVTLAMEDFAELKPYEKALKTKTVKQELISQQADQLKKYATDTTQDAAKQAEQQKQLAVMAQQQSKQFFNKIKDKEWQGMKMTASELNKLENYLENDFLLQNADGTLNYELFAKVGNYALNERTILTNTYKKGETKGYEKALAEFARANKNDTRFSSAPEVKNENKSERAQDARKKAFAN